MRGTVPKDGLELNKRLGEVHKALGLKQIEFAEGITVSQTYITNIEFGKRKVNDRVIRLAVMARTGSGEMFDQGGDPKTEWIIRNFKKLGGLLQDYVLKQVELAVEYQEKKGEG
jgi:transcriptional regulator with XRE-family HTH domain